MKLEAAATAHAARMSKYSESTNFADMNPPGVGHGVSQLLLENDGDEMQTCLHTLRTIFTNVLTHPETPKYRRIKKSNKKLKADVLSNVGGIEMLRSVGFIEQGEHIMLPMETPLFNLRSGLDALKASADLKWSQEEHKLNDQREATALSIAYELMYDMGNIDDPTPTSMRESRMRYHMDWKAGDSDRPGAVVNSLEELHAVMALEHGESLSVEQRMENRRRKLATEKTRRVPKTAFV